VPFSAYLFYKHPARWWGADARADEYGEADPEAVRQAPDATPMASRDRLKAGVLDPVEIATIKARAEFGDSCRCASIPTAPGRSDLDRVGRALCRESTRRH
jgi:hypothetical protein